MSFGSNDIGCSQVVKKTPSGLGLQQGRVCSCVGKEQKPLRLVFAVREGCHRGGVCSRVKKETPPARIRSEGGGAAMVVCVVV